MNRAWLAFCGILAPVLYLATVLIGGALTPNYNHMAQAISELIATGATHKGLLDPLFLLYNGLLIGFAFGLPDRNLSVSSKYVRRGSYGLMITGLAGILLAFFPMDPVGVAMSTTGKLHMVLAGVTSLGTMLSLLLAGIGFSKSIKWNTYAMYTFITLAWVFATGLIAVVGAANQSGYMGLLERCTIFGFMQWVFVMAVAVFAQERKLVVRKTVGL